MQIEQLKHKQQTATRPFAETKNTTGKNQVLAKWNINHGDCLQGSPQKFHYITHKLYSIVLVVKSFMNKLHGPCPEPNDSSPHRLRTVQLMSQNHTNSYSFCIKVWSAVQGFECPITTQKILKCILILSSYLHLGLPWYLLPVGFSNKILHAFRQVADCIDEI